MVYKLKDDIELNIQYNWSEALAREIARSISIETQKQTSSFLTAISSLGKRQCCKGQCVAGA